jgi:hypothetical protein
MYVAEYLQETLHRLPTEYAQRLQMRLTLSSMYDHTDMAQIQDILAADQLIVDRTDKAAIAVQRKGPVYKVQDALTRTPKANASIQERAQEDQLIGIIDPVTLSSEGLALSKQPGTGGIDIKKINIDKTGSTRIKLNDDAIRNVLQNGFNGFRPMILNVTPIQSPLIMFSTIE